MIDGLKPNNERLNIIGLLHPVGSCNCLLWYGIPLWKPNVLRSLLLRLNIFWNGAGATPKTIFCNTPNIAISRRTHKGAKLKSTKAFLFETPGDSRKSPWTPSINF